MGSDEIRKNDLVSLLNYRFSGSPVKGVEIGVLHGDLSLYLLENYNFEHLYGIDPYLDDDQRYQEVLFKMRYWIKKGKFTLIKAKSQDVHNFFEDESLDFVFIDGDHSYEGTLSDLNLYISKVVKGGLYVAHDWKWNAFPGIILAGLEFLSKNEDLFDPLLSNEELEKLGLNFKQAGNHEDKLYIHKQKNAVWPMWWRSKKL